MHEFFFSQVVLIGCDDALYWTDVTSKSHKLYPVKNFGPVFQMDCLAGLDVVAILTGEETKELLVLQPKC